MPLLNDDKKKIIEKFSQAQGDTGSAEVQISHLTERITRLVDHLKQHIHDVYSRRGLLTIVSKRRRLLNYLAKKAADRYKAIIASLGLSK